jgi:glyoxylase-like metal-dependent hydrolase (beta-lactamase superfamily II)
MSTRRRFVTAGVALAATGVLPWQRMGALAREASDFVRGPAVKDHPLERVAPHVWMIHSPDAFPTPDNQGMMCNITVVAGDKGLVVVDTGASVQIGEMSLRQIRQRFTQPIVALINTHYHGDHWLGNQAYVDAYGDSLPIHAHPGTIAAVRGVQGSSWHALMEKWTNQATVGTRIVPPNTATLHGQQVDLGDVQLRFHHYGVAHTPSDLCVEVVQDKVMLVGDVAMDKRIANMDDGSYQGTLKTYSQLEATGCTLWLPGHGRPGAGVLTWNRELFEGIYQSCEKAIHESLPLESAKARVLQDPRVAQRAAHTRGFESNIGKYVSLAYLEAEKALF